MIYGGDEKTITLHIKLIHPPIRSISVKAGSTVKELVAIAAEKFGWDAKFLKLHHMSKLMKLEERLSFYGVEDGDEIIAVNAKVRSCSRRIGCCARGGPACSGSTMRSVR